ncbi:murein biosynthesis integral membrane protein MurJ [Longimicrobium terrae]|uniref:Probable lipid II flippase MurJ n=1 Tax=Longimicrobium terrae TaxID=1639882 RepID=A0A841H4H2_9BACT|nr:murein biosynthesis integral membrane protein MurJ [Longimicrobium terrae]MBB4638644.1 putative peptidoglycan lipid II flippase [Longimicrobium terrae]MBB6072884.1 putative peptidoglycan lipid II flippase [Longimicrobium terrae]NNC31498.1 murein biosynthesis integral membrane protein MurJ [Longimicrobium terrae]
MSSDVPPRQDPLYDPDVTVEMGPDALKDAAFGADPVGEAAPGKPAEPAKGRTGNRGSMMVAAGILLSRIAGLVRQRVFAQYFGTSVYADVFNAAMRVPNFMQNLLGEGTLSASFIPVYAELLQEGKKEEAGRVAGAIFSLLLAVAGAMALIGVLFAPFLTTVFVPGFEGERREVTVQVVRILFPMTGVLVLSAWSLGILNSHRQFFLSYVAPVAWNAAMIATMWIMGHGADGRTLVVALAWGALLGGVLQFVVQIPGVLKLERSLNMRWGTHVAGVRETLRNAAPAVMGRGVVQISAWIDAMLASFLVVGAVSTMQYAMTLYLLPISLFGMSVAVAELPELARQRSGGAEQLRERGSAALERIAFYVLPSFVALVALGDVVVAGLFQTGEFTRESTLIVYVTTAGFATGLMATTASRLLSSTFFALRDTRTPARYATVRVVLSIVLGVVLMLQFEGVDLGGGWKVGPGLFGHVRVGGQPLGVFGLALGAGIAAWVEWWLLKRSLKAKIGRVAPRTASVVRMVAAAVLAAAGGWALKLAFPDLGPFPRAVVVCGAYGFLYFAIAAALGLEQAGAVFRRLRRMIGR